MTQIKNLLMGATALAAIGFGGVQLAGAANGTTPTAPTTASATAEAPGTETADDATGANEAPGTETADDQGDTKEAAETVTGTAAEQAKAAALKSVGSGKVTDVSAETQDSADATDQADTPEPGDTPDPASESKIAYDVEVTKADGTVADVHLDKAFAVLGSEVDQADGPETGADAGN